MRLLLTMLLASGCATSEPVSLVAKPTVSRPLNLEVPRLGGGTISLQRLRGKPVVIFMFTTWSLRSQLEAPRFVQLHDRQPGLTLIGIALDHGNHKLVETYVKYVGFRFDVAHLAPDDLDLVAAFGRISQVPRTVVLDRAGRIVQVHERGMTDFVALEKRLRALLSS